MRTISGSCSSDSLDGRQDAATTRQDTATTLFLLSRATSACVIVSVGVNDRKTTSPFYRYALWPISEEDESPDLQPPAWPRQLLRPMSGEGE